MITTPEYHKNDEFQQRSQKLREMRELGIDPYPAKYVPTHLAGELAELHKEGDLGGSDAGAAGDAEEVRIAGRMVLFRAMGKNAFATIQDDSGRIQVMFNRDLTQVAGFERSEENKPLKFIEKKLDLGDIIGVKGHLFRTQKGELTVYAKEVSVLCKTLLPLPEKHKGITDKEIRYRKRWLDLISNEDVKKTFQTRSRILKSVRNYFEENGFMEVETPTLQNGYGGAEAAPFITKHNTYDMEMFMRIALEIPLKKLVVGGMDRVFEIGKVFRNEGVDRTHNPEFTMLEAYAAFMDYNDVMILTENLFEMLALEIFGSTKVTIPSDLGDSEHEIDLKAPWKRLTMKEAILEYGGINVDELTEAQMRSLIKEQGNIAPAKYKQATRGKLIAILFEELAEPSLIQPHHITDHPIETTPLCKLHREPKAREERLVERFESFIGGREFCNAYTELNDPVLQRELLVEQAQKRLAGDEEAAPLDEEFIEAICQGMPPTGGLGIGIDRLVMLFTKMHTIRDVLYFPTMKPET